MRAITPVIPPKSNRKIKRDGDFALYAERNLVERFFNSINGPTPTGNSIWILPLTAIMMSKSLCELKMEEISLFRPQCPQLLKKP